MSKLKIDISVAAQADIDEITEYTKSTWGWRQADIYLDKLEEGFDLIAKSPSIGKPCSSIREGLRRFEIGKHIVFYIPSPSSLLIVRVLHERMLARRSRFEP